MTKKIRIHKGQMRRRTSASEGEVCWDISAGIAHESWGEGLGMLTVNIGGQYLLQPMCSDQMLELAGQLLETARALNPPEVQEPEPPAQAA